MPGKKHLQGVGDKEQREYEHIKESAQDSGRYGDRAEEVAARTVMKHHKERGHKTGKKCNYSSAPGLAICTHSHVMLNLIQHPGFEDMDPETSSG